MSSSMVHVLHHPLAAVHLTALRDRRTQPAEFRRLVSRLTTMLALEAMAALATRSTPIETPVTSCDGAALSQRIAIVPILRAGMGMVEPVLELLPEAEVWHLGLFRDERTLLPVQYYNKLPSMGPPDVAVIVDPMLATGGSASWAIDAMGKWGVRRIKQLSLIASEPGLKLLTTRYGEVEFYVAAVDPKLNERGYIVPGLGDAGDRIYHTHGV
jgi:uracil phosphoribosyltransferase